MTNKSNLDDELSSTAVPTKTQLLDFKPTGRIIPPIAVAAEFRMMKDACKKPPTATDFERVCKKSGTHLIKLVTPRADGDHAVLRIEEATQNVRPALFPSLNAPDIPFAKIIFRPLEIEGAPAKSLVDHVRNSDDSSTAVCDAFAQVFGAPALRTVQEFLQKPVPVITKLASGEFPIVFIPSPVGGDLQVTPVAPAKAYMGMKEVASPYFLAQEKDGPKRARGTWHRQKISDNFQNISGAIGGPRMRFLAEMPAGLSRRDAELFAYCNGGPFPRWRNADVQQWLQDYRTLLDRHETYNNKDTRAGLDRFADRLITEALDYAEETYQEAKLFAEAADENSDFSGKQPGCREILLSDFWKTDERNKARTTLQHPHFLDRLNQIAKVRQQKAGG